jgi:hypothetical protein
LVVLKKGAPMGTAILRSLEPQMRSFEELREDVMQMSGGHFIQRMFPPILGLWEDMDYVKFIPEIGKYDIWDPPARFNVTPLMPRSGRPRKWDIAYRLMKGMPIDIRKSECNPNRFRKQDESTPPIEGCISRILSVYDRLGIEPKRWDLKVLAHEIAGGLYNESVFDGVLNYCVLKGKVRYDPVSSSYSSCR